MASRFIAYMGTDEMANLNQIEPFSTRVDRAGDLVTVAITGELDFSVSDQFSTTLSEAGDSTSRLRLDFERCTFIDSAGIQVVVDNARTYRDDGSELSVINLRGDVAKVFRITDLLSESSPIQAESP